ncbi:hypothetical protein KKF34_03545 [Myxococcota bacterium]|nr:hypothetical protein [Myxococcota bacterium]MBU1380442.1 hypothetical protein [Myxococcota bacterium]MBU1495931.1 hypothetical protein [Myxococcota bacterium]
MGYNNKNVWWLPVVIMVFGAVRFRRRRYVKKMVFLGFLAVFAMACDDDTGPATYKKTISVYNSLDFQTSNFICSINFEDARNYSLFEEQSSRLVVPVNVRLFSSSGNSFDQTFSIDFNNFAEMNGKTITLADNLKVTFNFNSEERSGYEYSNPVHSGWIHFLRNKTDFITIESTESSASFGVEITSPVWGNFSAGEQVYDFTDGIDISAQLEVVR